MTQQSMNSNDLERQALHWFIRVEAGDMTAEERREFEAWWLSDPRHGEALAQQTGWWAAFEDLLTPQIRAQCAAAMEKMEGCVAVKSREPRGFAKFAIAAGLLLAVVGGWFGLRDAGVMPRQYATPTGEYRPVTLADGSVAYLNTRTRIQWLGGLSDRRVALLEGEALFDVAPDAARPFRVLVDRSEILVLGTRFNVYRKKSGEVRVTVLEGTVQVQQDPNWKRVLKQNEQLAYHATGMPSAVRSVDALRVVQWRQGAIDIKDTPLSEVVEELSRYTDQPITAADPRLQSIQVMAVLQVPDVRKSLALLEQLVPITVTEAQGGFQLAYRDTLAPGP